MKQEFLLYWPLTAITEGKGKAFPLQVMETQWRWIVGLPSLH
jgi:hypothetical protein